ncbi:MAG: hypothetical protein FD123_2690 [Bacteroidetes bacterium]|nr:MAG: hypothetical protein FD123_2690 [Bacteroidota bacterium]
MKLIRLLSISLGMTGMLFLASCQKETLTPVGTGSAGIQSETPGRQQTTEGKGTYRKGLWWCFDELHYGCSDCASCTCYVYLYPKESSTRWTPDEVLAALQNGGIELSECVSPDCTMDFVNHAKTVSEEQWLVPGVDNPAPRKVNTFSAYYDEDGNYVGEVTYQQ